MLSFSKTRSFARSLACQFLSRPVKRIAFAGGGTGGHIFPGIAVAEALARDGSFELFWIASSSGRDREMVEAAGLKIEFYGVPSGKLRRYFSLKNVADIFKIAAGFFCSLIILTKIRPSVLFSKGGFVSVPPCYAAKVLKIPVITHESDFSPGLATKLNAKVATRILLTYNESAAFFPKALKGKCEVTGNPVRSRFFEASKERGKAFLGIKEDALVLLALGGSTGAESVNRLVLACLNEFCSRFIVVHQTGGKTNALPTKDLAAAKEMKKRGRYIDFSFISAEMPDVLAAADLVISRAGASAVWECAAAGKPMLLIPLEKGSSRGDQIENAAWFERRGAALVFSESSATAEKLAQAVSSIFIGDEGARKVDVMRKAIASCPSAGGQRSAERIAEILKSTPQE